MGPSARRAKAAFTSVKEDGVDNGAAVTFGRRTISSQAVGRWQG